MNHLFPLQIQQSSLWQAIDYIETEARLKIIFERVILQEFFMLIRIRSIEEPLSLKQLHTLTKSYKS